MIAHGIAMESIVREHDADFDADWTERERYWKRKLGRVRIGVEPVEEQLVKYRRATWMLTAVAFGLATMFVSLFSAFRRPDVGLIAAGVLLLPIVVLAWIEFGVLRLRVVRYIRERDDYLRRKAASGRT